MAGILGNLPVMSNWLTASSVPVRGVVARGSTEYGTQFRHRLGGVFPCVCARVGSVVSTEHCVVLSAESESVSPTDDPHRLWAKPRGRANPYTTPSVCHGPEVRDSYTHRERRHAKCRENRSIQWVDSTTSYASLLLYSVGSSLSELSAASGKYPLRLRLAREPRAVQRRVKGAVARLVYRVGIRSGSGSGSRSGSGSGSGSRLGSGLGLGLGLGLIGLGLGLGLGLGFGFGLGLTSSRRRGGTPRRRRAAGARHRPSRVAPSHQGEG